MAEGEVRKWPSLQRGWQQKKEANFGFRIRTQALQNTNLICVPFFTTWENTRKHNDTTKTLHDQANKTEHKNCSEHKCVKIRSIHTSVQKRELARWLPWRTNTNYIQTAPFHRKMAWVLLFPTYLSQAKWMTTYRQEQKFTDHESSNFGLFLNRTAALGYYVRYFCNTLVIIPHYARIPHIVGSYRKRNNRRLPFHGP